MRAVLLPGMDGGADLLQRFRRALDPNVAADVVAYPPDQAIGYEGLEDVVRTSLATRPLPTALIAESFSGPLAIRIGASPPSNLRCIVLVATFDRPPVPRFLTRFVGSVAFRRPPPAFIVRRLMLGNDAGDDEVASVQQAIAKVDASVLASRLRAVLNVDVVDQAQAIQLPVLCVRPTQDRLVRRPLVARTGWEEQTVSGPHLILQRRPVECARHILQFIRATADD